MSTGNVGFNRIGNEFDNLLQGAADDDTLNGMAGNDTLEGFEGCDTLIGGAGNDSLEGGDGVDTYQFEAGFGFDAITDDDGDVLHMGTGIAPEDVRLVRGTGTDIDDLLVFVDVDAVRLNGFYDNASDPTGFFSEITFEDGGAAIDLATTGLNVLAGAGSSERFGANTDDVLDGEAGNDTLKGLDGDDTLIGGAGNDSLEGGDGVDTYQFEAGFGFDAITDDDGDVLHMGTGIAPEDVRLVRGTGTDIDDLLVFVDVDAVRLNGFYDNASDPTGFFSEITFEDGGAAIDLATTGLNVLAGAGSSERFGANTDDVLDGEAGNDTLKGLDGDDTLIGGAGNDSLEGGDGVDTYQFEAGFGFDAITDDDGDVLHMGTGIAPEDVRLVRGTGTDIDDLLVFVDVDAVRLNGFYDNASDPTGFFSEITFEDGGAAIDLATTGLNVLAGAGSSERFGANTDDVLDGEAGNDTLKGLDGDDTLIGGAGNDSLEGGDGVDTYQFEAGFGFDAITDDDGDVLHMGTGIAPEDVRLVRGTGTDIDDLLVFVDVDAVRLNGFYDNASDPTGFFSEITFEDGGAAIDLATTGLNVLAGAGSSERFGANTDDVLDGEAGNDTLKGLDGDDTLIGGAGNDSLEGGDGVDTYQFEAGFGFDAITDDDGDVLHMGTGIAPEDVRLVRGTGTDIDDLLVFVDVDAVRLNGFYDNASDPTGFFSEITFEDGGAAIDLATTGLNVLAGAGSSERFGANTDDVLDGEAGNDTLKGLDGDDTLIGGAGNDSLEGGDGVDTASYAEETGGSGVTLDLALGTATDSYGDTDQLNSIENVTGSQWNDLISGDVEDNHLIGAEGRDTLVGQDGDDTLDGGNGGDELEGGRGSDLAFGGNKRDIILGGYDDDILIGRAGNDLIKGNRGADSLVGGADDDRLWGGAQGDTIDGGTGNDLVKAGDGRDLVTMGDGADIFVDTEQGGANGRDTVDGGAGEDTLNSWGGNDLLTGGADADIFAFALGSDHDTIADFEDGVDMIDLSAWSLVGGFTDLKVRDVVGGVDVLRDGDPSDQIFLAGLTKADIDAGDFVFV